MEQMPPVYTLKNECQDCYKCVRKCPIKAIKILNSSASIINDRCITCGHCVTICPTGAKHFRNDINKVKTLIQQEKKVFVSLAPSWSGISDLSASQITALLKKLGFYAVSETALGAQEVSVQTANIIKNSDSKLHISSACPTIVDFIRYYHPQFSKNIVPIASPALTHAKMLKEHYGNDISVVFIGPCIAKKNESDRNNDLISASLTFEELKLWLKESFININDFKEDIKEQFVPFNAYEGSLYPIEGGMNETIKKAGIDKNIQLLSISSIEFFEKALNSLDVNSLKEKLFIEALACSGGCINGPVKATKKSSLSVSSNILYRTKERSEIPKTATTVVSLEYKEESKIQQEPTIEQINLAMKMIGKHSESDELNCGGCGYSSCRDLAKALIYNEAEPSMCVSFMRKTAMKKASAMLRSMPSCAVIADRNLDILEANKAFMKMFCPDIYETIQDENVICGVNLKRILDFYGLFEDVLKYGKDIHKEHYYLKDKIYDISIFVIEQDNIIGAIISDITKSEINKEKIVTKAQEVIDRNISIVQDIACRLGEHMVETELLLNTIIEDFNTKDNKDNK